MKKRNSSKVKEFRAGKGSSVWKNGHPRGMKGKPHPFKGKSYEEIYGSDAATKRKEHLSERLAGNRSWSKMSDETKHEIASNQRDRILRRYEAGWLPKAGRCRKIHYTSRIAGDVVVDGSWELEVVKYFDRMGWRWRRNTTRFPYVNLEGETSHYTPDFYVEELGGYLEIKGYETALDRCKWAQFSHKLTVWRKQHILAIKESGPDGKAADC